MRYELTIVFAFIILVFAMPALAENVDQSIQALKDDNSSVRSESAKALGWLKDDRAVEPLFSR